MEKLIISLILQKAIPEIKINGKVKKIAFR